MYIVFTGWIVVIFIWLFIAALWITMYPIWESRDSFVILYRKITGRQLDTSGTTIEKTKGGEDEDLPETEKDEKEIDVSDDATPVVRSNAV
jgi:hypothetical protein